MDLFTRTLVSINLLQHRPQWWSHFLKLSLKHRVNGPLNFTIFSCRFDYLEIRDGGTSNAPLMSKNCGDQRPSSHKSTGKVLYVRFRSDTSHRGELKDSGPNTPPVRFKVGYQCNIACKCTMCKYSVADPGFSRRGVSKPRGDANLLFWQFFPKMHESEKKCTEIFDILCVSNNKCSF